MSFIEDCEQCEFSPKHIKVIAHSKTLENFTEELHWPCQFELQIILIFLRLSIG